MSQMKTNIINCIAVRVRAFLAYSKESTAAIASCFQISLWITQAYVISGLKPQRYLGPVHDPCLSIPAR